MIYMQAEGSLGFGSMMTFFSQMGEEEGSHGKKHPLPRTSRQVKSAFVWKKESFPSVSDHDESESSQQPAESMQKPQVRPGREMDALLVAIGKNRDKEAFSRLFDFYAPRLKSYLMRLGADSATAEELTQEVLLTAWDRAAQFDPTQAGASTWLFTIARNRRIDLARKLSKGALDPEEPNLKPVEQPSADQQIESSQREALIQKAVLALPKEQAQLLKLSFFADKSHQQISDETGLPLGTVKSRLRLALNRLRKMLSEELMTTEDSHMTPGPDSPPDPPPEKNQLTQARQTSQTKGGS